MKPFVARLYVFLILPLLLVACSVRDARYQPYEMRINRAVLPPDVIAPTSGIRAAQPSDDLAVMCCAIDPTAHLRVKKSIDRPRLLALSLYWPDQKNDSGKVTVDIAGRLLGSWSIRKPGFHTFTFKLQDRIVKSIASESAVGVFVKILPPRTKPILTSIYFE